MAHPPQFTGFYYFSYILLIVKLFLFSVVSLLPLPSFTYWTIHAVKEFPLENTQSSFIIFCHSQVSAAYVKSGPLSGITFMHLVLELIKISVIMKRWLMCCAGHVMCWTCHVLDKSCVGHVMC